MSDLAHDLIAQNTELVNQRALYMATWNDVGDYLNVYRQYRTSATPGANKMTKIYTSAPMRAHQVLVAGLYSLLTSPSVPWFAIEMRNKLLNKLASVKKWLEDATLRIYSAYSNSGLYNALSEFYRDLTSFGIACMYIGTAKFPRTFRFETVNPYNFTYAEDSEGEVDTIFREIKWTARQAKQEFPSGKFNDKITQHLATGDKRMYTDRFPFLHVVCPRADRDPGGKSSLNMAFASYYIDVEAGEIVDESGYEEFPYAVARWERPSNEPYGQCPGTTALPDIKTANDRKRVMLLSEQKVLNPPLDIPENYKGRINTSPGGLNYRDGGTDRIAKLDIAGRIDISKEMLDYDLEQVNKAFFVDVFQLLANIERQMTAFEVSKREAERMLMFGPVVGRLTHETLNNLIIRTFNIAVREFLFLDPPEEIQGQEWDIVYISPLARAQRAAQGQALQGALGFLLPMVQYFPQMMDNLNSDEVMDYVFELYGCPTDLLNPPEVRDEKRATRMQMQQREMGLQQMERTAESIGKAGRANLSTLKGLSDNATAPGGSVPALTSGQAA